MFLGIEGQTKAVAAFKGINGVYQPILLKVCKQVAQWPSLIVRLMVFEIKGQKRPQRPLKVIGLCLTFEFEGHVTNY